MNIEIKIQPSKINNIKHIEKLVNVYNLGVYLFNMPYIDSIFLICDDTRLLIKDPRFNHDSFPEMNILFDILHKIVYVCYDNPDSGDKIGITEVEMRTINEIALLFRIIKSNTHPMPDETVQSNPHPKNSDHSVHLNRLLQTAKLQEQTAKLKNNTQ